MKNKNTTKQLKCQKLLRSAIKHRKIKRPKKCTLCGSSKRISAHHQDYNNPFKVAWLCASCHSRYHHNKTFKDIVKLRVISYNIDIDFIKNESCERLLKEVTRLLRVYNYLVTE